MKPFNAILLLSLLLLLPSISQAADDHKYAGAKKCKSCHKKAEIGNQYGSWLETKHAKAYETLASDKAKKWAAEAGVSDAQTDEKCVKCHVTAHGVDPERLPSKFALSEGVQCEACHGAGKDYRKKKIMIDRKLAEEKGLIPQSPAVCTGCHNDESPAWNPEAYTLADGTKTGFDYDQAVAKIAHPVPEGYDPMADGGAD
jgi:YD repeat-containing protein